MPTKKKEVMDVAGRKKAVDKLLATEAKKKRPLHAPRDMRKVTAVQQAAAAELLARRRGRKGLLEFTKYTFPRFETSWHHDAICKLLERVDAPVTDEAIIEIDGKPFNLKLPNFIRRCMIFAPPRHTKSELTSIRRPAWSLGRDEKRMFMNITYGNDLAYTFSKACKGTIKSEPYQRLFPGVKLERDATERWKLRRSAANENQRDSMIASGILSPLTGEGATDITVDDPFKNKSEAYSKTIRERVYDEYQTSIRTRLQPGGSIALMLTRWHKDDLAGRLLAQAEGNPKADQWIVMVLAATNDDGFQSYIYDTKTGKKNYLPAYEALWPAWFDRENLDATKASLAPAFWNAMYQQSPTSVSGSIFLSEKWGEFDGPQNVDRRVHVWDTAMEDTDTADFSAYLQMGMSGNNFYIEDGYRERLSFPDLVKKVYEKWDAALLRGEYPERCLIENRGSGISLIQTIESNNVDPAWEGSFIPVLAMPATINKTVRALSISGYQNGGAVALPMHEFPSGITDSNGGKAEFIDEHTDFDKGKNDDWVDCTTHALTYYTRPIVGEEHEETIVYEDEVTINSLLDQYDQGMFF